MINFKKYFTKYFKGNSLDTVNFKRRKIKLIGSHYSCSEFINGIFPSFWSDNACTIVASKYFQKKKEYSVKHVIERLVNRIAEYSIKDGYMSGKSSEVFKQELAYLLVNQYASFSSPVWFNLGTDKSCNKQTSSCFVLSLEDNISSIIKTQSSEILIAKGGGGAGVINSKIRSSKDKISGGCYAPGPISFMKARDSWASIMLCGDIIRKFPKMEILHYWHPDIDIFVKVKMVEESKAHKLGNEYNPLFQNSNFSVRLDSKFWLKFNKNEEICTYDKDHKKILYKYNAQKLISNIARATYYCGDPGLQYEDTIYKWITVKGNPQEIVTNPCAEYIWYPNSACNLASLNLMKFIMNDGEIDYKSLEKAVSIFITALDILVHNAEYPTEAIKSNSLYYRNLGLGISNLGATLLRLGIAYDSDEACMIAKKFQSHILYYSVKQSLVLSKEIGRAEGFDKHKMIESFMQSSDFLKGQKYIYDNWNRLIEKVGLTGLRNCQLTAIAPTGTISFLMDCETTGIEPFLYLKQFKNVMDGYKLFLCLPSLKYALRHLNYDESKVQLILYYYNHNGTLEGCKDLKKNHISIFDTSCSSVKNGRSIRPSAHINMVSAITPFVNSGISKTINLPVNISIKDIEKLYIEAYEKGLKSISMYREGSKLNQVLEPAINECC